MILSKPPFLGSINFGQRSLFGSLSDLVRSNLKKACLTAARHTSVYPHLWCIAQINVNAHVRVRVYKQVYTAAEAYACMVGLLIGCTGQHTMVYIVMAYMFMAYIVMAYMVMACTVMAYIFMV